MLLILKDGKEEALEYLNPDQLHAQYFLLKLHLPLNLKEMLEEESLIRILMYVMYISCNDFYFFKNYFRY